MASTSENAATRASRQRSRLPWHESARQEGAGCLAATALIAGRARGALHRRRAARGEVRRDAEVLAALTALRQIGSAFKLTAAERLIEALRAKGEAVVLFTAFVASARSLHRRFGYTCQTQLRRGSP